MHEQEDNKKHLMAKGEQTGITYIGRKASQPSKYLIGIKAGKTIRIFDAPCLEFSQYINKLQAQKMAETNEENYFDQKARLVEDFGTKKSKKIINSLKANMVSEDAIASSSQMKKILTHKAKQIDANEDAIREEAKMEEIIENKNLLPPHDEKTKDPKEVYPIYGSIAFISRTKGNI